ncbi:MAG: hypothetical protein ACJARO_000566, partial [Bacteriovoracaceae bacterium]
LSGSKSPQTNVEAGPKTCEIDDSTPLTA